MTLDYSTHGKVQVESVQLHQNNYWKNYQQTWMVLSIHPLHIISFLINPNPTLLDVETTTLFHHLVAKLAGTVADTNDYKTTYYCAFNIGRE